MSAFDFHPWVQTLGWTLLHFLWQGALLGVLAALGLRGLRARSAQARYLWACAGFAAMALAPVLTFIWLPAPGASANGLEIVQETGATLALGGSITWAERVRGGLAPYLPWALAMWGVGVFALSLRMVGAWLWLQALRIRQTSPASAEWHLRLSSLQRRLGISQTVTLLKTTMVDAPLVIGWLRPVILVPASAFLGLAPETLEAVLAHELAHIRRHDYLVNLFQSVVEILLFYHPAVWWLSAQIRTERENCCDDVAVAYCGDALAYAKALAALEGLRAPALPRTELALAANGGSLMHRIQRLLLPTLPPSPTRRAGILALLAVSVLGAGSVIRLKEEPPKPPTQTPKPEESKKHLVIVDHDRKVKVKSKGKVELKPQSPDMVVVGEGGAFELKVQEGDSTRAFTVTRKGEGEVRTYTIDGQTKEMAAADREWLKQKIEEIHQAEAKAPKSPKRSFSWSMAEGDGPGEHKRIVIDAEKIQKDVERHLKHLEARNQGERKRHKIRIDVPRTLVIEDHDFEAPDLDFDFEFHHENDGKEGEGTRRHVIRKRVHAGGAKAEADILRSTIEKLQKRLDRLEKGEGDEDGTLPRTPKPPKPPKAPKVPALPAPPNQATPPPAAPAPPAPPAPPES